MVVPYAASGTKASIPKRAKVEDAESKVVKPMSSKCEITQINGNYQESLVTYFGLLALLLDPKILQSAGFFSGCPAVFLECFVPEIPSCLAWHCSTSFCVQ